MSMNVHDPDELKRALMEEDGGKAFEAACGAQARRARERAEKGYCDRDLWDIGSWLLEIMPAMLEEYKRTRNGSPSCLGENHPDERGIVVNEKCHAEWDAILDKMIFLFREAREETCSRQNPHDDAHTEAHEAFIERYGLCGEGLASEEEKVEFEGKPYSRMHFMSEAPEFAEIDKLWRDEEDALKAYREKNRVEAMELLSRWMPCLWD